MLSSLDIVLSSLGMIIMLSSQTDPVDCVMLSITYHHWEWYVIITDPVHHSLTDQASLSLTNPQSSPIPHPTLTFPHSTLTFPHPILTYPSPNPQSSPNPHLSLTYPSSNRHLSFTICWWLLSSLAYRSIITGEVGETYVPSVLHALRVHSSTNT